MEVPVGVSGKRREIRSMVEVGCAVECVRSFELGGEYRVSRLAYRGCHVILERADDSTIVLVQRRREVATRLVFDVNVPVRGISLGSREVVASVSRWRSASSLRDADGSPVGVVRWCARTSLPPFCGSTPS